MMIEVVGSTDVEPLQKALSLALAQINRRERTVAEVRAHLERKGVSQPTAEAVIAELRREHLLDDERFAELFVADQRALQSWGSDRIRRGLLARGVDRELAERALAAADAADAAAGDGDGDGEDEAAFARVGAAGAGGAGARPRTELQRALALLRRRFPDPPRDRRDRDRALGVLLRKGYESELALDALAAHARDD
jgi:regulatory protein